MGSLICFRVFFGWLVLLGLSFYLPGEFEHLRRWMNLEEDRPEEAVPVYRRKGGPGAQPSTSSTICMDFL